MPDAGAPEAGAAPEEAGAAEAGAEADAAVLLTAARDAIEAATLGRAPRPADAERDEPYRAPRATFVTLRGPDGALRGCIGELVAYRSLIESVRDCAIGAATRDPRFLPVTADELAGLHLGISVLSPATPIAPSEVEVGRHGLLLELHGRRGVLLPEVAAERNWSTQEYLRALAGKAGLPDDAWRDRAAKLSAFETRKIAEPPRRP